MPELPGPLTGGRAGAPERHSGASTLVAVRHRLLLGMALVGLAGSLVAVAAVGAQTYAELIAAEERSIGDLHGEIAAYEAQVVGYEADLDALDALIAEIDALIATEDAELALLPIHLELLADDLLDVLNDIDATVLPAGDEAAAAAASAVSAALPRAREDLLRLRRATRLFRWVSRHRRIPWPRSGCCREVRRLRSLLR